MADPREIPMAVLREVPREVPRDVPEELSESPTGSLNDTVNLGKALFMFVFFHVCRIAL